jgi:hypothetical protein
MNLIWVTEAKYVSDYKIMLIFNDGIQGIVDLKNSIKGKIFKPLQDIEYFKRFNKNKWTIEWDCEADFAPEYLYQLVKKDK